MERGQRVGAAEDRRGAVLGEDPLEQRDAVAGGVLQPQPAAAHGDVDLVSVDAVRGQPVGGLRERRAPAQLVGDELDAGRGVVRRHEVEAEVLVGAAQQRVPTVAVALAGQPQQSPVAGRGLVDVGRADARVVDRADHGQRPSS